MAELPPPSTDRSHLVVIGSSAGGIEALMSVISGLPPDFPAAIVIAQHLDPRRPSRLDEILTQHTTLAVRLLEDSQPLDPGTIFVVPSDRHVEITDHTVSLSTAARRGPKPSVDLLFESAARVFGERLIAVVLSGTGSDGAAGARIVHEAGGTVIVQNPETAAFPGMPRSLAPATIDVTADLERIGGLLHELAVRDGHDTGLGEERDYRLVLARLRGRYGIDFSSYRQPTIMRRLQRRLVTTNCSTISEYLRYLEAHQQEEQQLLSSFLVNVTDFFRDAKTFAYLRERVLPRLLTEARSRNAPLRIWSAGCATGEEPYSLAILVNELLAPELSPEPSDEARKAKAVEPSVRIFATDLDSDALAFARRGVYPARAVKQMPARLLARYFQAADGDYEVAASVRELILFGQHDLAQSPPFPQIDLLLCRNVLMYFTPELQQHVLESFAFALRDDGYLLLGSAETPRPLAELFTPEQSNLRIYRRTGARASFVSHRMPTPALATARAATIPHTPLPLRSLLPLRPTEAPSDRLNAESIQGLIGQLPIGLVVVDRRYQIQLSNIAARRLLGIRGLAEKQDLIHLAQNLDDRALRAAVDRAFRTGTPTTLKEVPTTGTGLEEVRYVEIVCSPHRWEEEKGRAQSSAPPSAVLVSIVDVTDLVRDRQRSEGTSSTQRQEIERLTTMVERLRQTNQELVTANEELARMEEAARLSNEEYLTANEESQSAHEELETYAEELQSTGEELETLNEELKATVEELTLSNGNLDAQAEELMLERRVSEEARAALAAMFASLTDGVVVVDRMGRPIQVNPAYEELVASAQVPFAPRDIQGEPLRESDNPFARAGRGETFTVEFDIFMTDGTRRWFEVKGNPIPSALDARDGPIGQARGVIVFRDVSERTLRQLQEETLAAVGHELRAQLTSARVYVELLGVQAASGVDPEQLAPFTDRALASVDRLNRQVEDLNDVQYLQRGELFLEQEPVDLISVVRQVVATVRMLTSSQEIRFQSSDESPVITGDQVRIEQVLLNLLTNATTHAQESETIDVRVGRAAIESGADHNAIVEPEEWAEIQVQDYGPGIAADELPHIFERNYRSQRGDQSVRKGLGLGLFIAREIVNAHGGRMGVRSELGAGTTFTVLLPIRSQQM